MWFWSFKISLELTLFSFKKCFINDSYLFYLAKLLDKIFTLIMTLNIKIPPYECNNWFPNVIIIYVYNISTHRDSALQLIITKFRFIVPNDVLILYSSLCPYSPVIYIKIGKVHEVIYVNCVYMVEILYTASFPDCVFSDITLVIWSQS